LLKMGQVLNSIHTVAGVNGLITSHVLNE
jgi:hypothetical protein